jgi:uncharacterized protein (DUF885 family)
MEEIAAAYEALIKDAEQKVTVIFDLRPKADVVVIAGENGDYYTPPAVDGSRPGMFYARVTGREWRFSMPTLAYHEAVPGHHFQLVGAGTTARLRRRRSTPRPRSWALYAKVVSS